MKKKDFASVQILEITDFAKKKKKFSVRLSIIRLSHSELYFFVVYIECQNDLLRFSLSSEFSLFIALLNYYGPMK